MAMSTTNGTAKNNGSSNRSGRRQQRFSTSSSCESLSSATAAKQKTIHAPKNKNYFQYFFLLLAGSLILQIYLFSILSNPSCDDCTEIQPGSSLPGLTTLNKSQTIIHALSIDKEDEYVGDNQKDASLKSSNENHIHEPKQQTHSVAAEKGEVKGKQQDDYWVIPPVNNHHAGMDSMYLEMEDMHNGMPPPENDDLPQQKHPENELHEHPRTRMTHPRAPPQRKKRPPRPKDWNPPIKQSLLPKKVITVFGPESSGTTFLATTLGVAIGAFAKEGRWIKVPGVAPVNHPGSRNIDNKKPPERHLRWVFEPKVNRRVMSLDGEWEIQHLSLPWGWHCEEGVPLDVVEALVPAECFRYADSPHLDPVVAEGHHDHEAKMRNHGRESDPKFSVVPEMDAEEERLLRMCRNEVHISENNEEYKTSVAADESWTCGAKCGRDRYDGYATYPKRFSVNITSHIDWYLSRGVDITVLISTRDRSISATSKLSQHCHIDQAAKDEDEMALEFMKEALEKYGRRGSNGGKPRVLPVSYEGMMGMKESYLRDLYEQLGINSTYMPEFKDGNSKYVRAPEIEEKKTDPNQLAQSKINSRPPKPQNFLPPPPKQSLLPKKIITVVGPESSGTTFLSTTLGVALGAFSSGGQWVQVPAPDSSHVAVAGTTDGDSPQSNTKWVFEENVERRAFSSDGQWEIQHLSLPWGWFCQDHPNIKLVDALVPEECFRYEDDADLDPRIAESRWYYSDVDDKTSRDIKMNPDVERLRELCRDEVHISDTSNNCGAKCGQGRHNGFALYPKRFSLNITSHIEWYISRGVDITVVLSLRDRSISKKSKLAGHCNKPGTVQVEEDMASKLMIEAFEKYGKNRSKDSTGNINGRIIAVSYEGLMEMKEAYLFDVYYQLGINSTYVPSFLDGNQKYVGDAASPHQQQQEEGDMDEEKLKPLPVSKQHQSEHQHPLPPPKKKRPPVPKHPPPPKTNLLPKKVVTVFGPESSGTTFLATALGVAIGAFSKEGNWNYILQPGKPDRGARPATKQLPPRKTWAFDDDVGKRVMSLDGEWEIQHLSLPWGWMCGDPQNSGINVVDALVPDECIRYERDPGMDIHLAEATWFRTKQRNERIIQARAKRVGKHATHRALLEDHGLVQDETNHVDANDAAENARLQGLCQDQAHISESYDSLDSPWTCGAKCGRNQYSGYALYPQRFFVNITSHIEWYLSRGVDVTVILSMRDRTVSHKSKTTGHCKIEGVSQKEDDLALDLMREAMEKYGIRGTKRGSLPQDESGKQRAIAMSYEGLMGMKEGYLFGLYKELGINSTYAPSFKDGNTKYVGDADEEKTKLEQQKLEKLGNANTTPQQHTDHQPSPEKQSPLPKRVITVFGPESIGTNFLTTTLAGATGMSLNEGQWIKSLDGEFEMQQVTLPTGAKCSPNTPTNIIYDMIPGAAVSRQRYFVNITSHIEWYLSRDVDITVVLSIRDNSIAKKEANAAGQCDIPELAEIENESALKLMREAFAKYGKHGSHLMKGNKSGSGSGSGKERVIIASYEGLMEMKDVYLFEIYRQLGINSTYVPSLFVDRNEKYVKDPPEKKKPLPRFAMQHQHQAGPHQAMNVEEKLNWLIN